jgi:hypothetical protein
MRGFYVRADFASIARIDATVAHLAEALKALGDERCADDRRVAAVLLMANPPQAMRLLGAYAAHRAQKNGQHTDDAVEEVPADPAGDQPLDDDEMTTPRRFRPAEIEPAASPDFEWDESKLLPAVWLFVHLARRPSAPDGPAVGDGFAEHAASVGAAEVTEFPVGREPAPADAGRLARVEGLGPVSTEWVRRVLGRRCRFKITPVLDPEGLAPVDGYEVPATHRAAQHALTPADVFPYAAHTGPGMQLDHTIAYDSTPDPRTGGAPPGQSRIGNYGPMTGFHHRVKTHGGWLVRQPFPGIYVWRDPYGAFYLVDPTGTRRLGTPPRPQRPATTDSPMEQRLGRLTRAA